MFYTGEIYTLRLIQYMTGCKCVRYYVPHVHEKLVKVTIRIFRMTHSSINLGSLENKFEGVEWNGFARMLMEIGPLSCLPQL